ncbi:MAG: reverse transcriptase domain-containing protein [bacterium]
MNAELFSAKEILSAYLDCRKRKRNTINSIEFEIDQVSQLTGLNKVLSIGKYQPGKSICFVVKYPKNREIFAADFKDRVVHHLLVRELEKHWEKVFIFDSFACRKNKGTLAAVERLTHFMRSSSDNGKKRAYYLQLDVKNFFMSINKSVLFKIIDAGLRKMLRISKDKLLFDEKKLAKYNELYNLTAVILFNDPTINFQKKGTLSDWERLDSSKSLFNAPAGTGIPIGNLTSQFFANVYLNELDQFAKHKSRLQNSEHLKSGLFSISESLLKNYLRFC